MASGLATQKTPTRPPRRKRGFARDDNGALAVEFGLLAVPFFSILGAILETAMVFLSGQVLDSAVQDVSRLIRTGQAQQANVSPEAFKGLVCDRLFGLFPDCNGPNGLHVEVQPLSTFGEIDFTPPVKWVCAEDEEPETCNAWTRAEGFTTGGGSEIVSVQVYYKWSLIMPLGLGLGNLPSGERLMGAASVFRNEPFS
jgi:Flp pilus assembly pilin Flp